MSQQTLHPKPETSRFASIPLVSLPCLPSSSPFLPFLRFLPLGCDGAVHSWQEGKGAALEMVFDLSYSGSTAQIDKSLAMQLALADSYAKTAAGPEPETLVEG